MSVEGLRFWVLLFVAIAVFGPTVHGLLSTYGGP